MDRQNKRYTTTKDRDSRLDSNYERACRVNHLPVVYAKGGGKYREVTMDLIYVPNAQWYNQSEDFTEKVKNAIERSGGKARIEPGLLTKAYRVPAESAEQLMRDLLAIYDGTGAQEE